jgi:hypothetical protein
VPSVFLWRILRIIIHSINTTITHSSHRSKGSSGRHHQHSRSWSSGGGVGMGGVVMTAVAWSPVREGVLATTQVKTNGRISSMDLCNCLIFD